MTNEPEERHHTDADYDELKDTSEKRIEYLEANLKTMTDLESDRRVDIQELEAKLDRWERNGIRAAKLGDEAFHEARRLRVELEWIKKERDEARSDCVKAEEKITELCGEMSDLEVAYDELKANLMIDLLFDGRCSECGQLLNGLDEKANLRAELERLKKQGKED